HHADDFVRRSIEQNAAADGRRIAVQTIHPEAVTGDGHGRPVLFLLGPERTPEDRTDAHHVEVIAGDVLAEYLRRLAEAGQRERDAKITGETGEDLRVVAQVLELGTRRTEWGERTFGRLAVRPHEPIGIGIRNRPDEQAVNEREDRGIRAD